MKDNFLTRLVFLGSGPRSLTAKFNEPLPAAALSGYFHVRGRKVITLVQQLEVTCTCRKSQAKKPNCALNPATRHHDLKERLGHLDPDFEGSLLEKKRQKVREVRSTVLNLVLRA